jgi:hypothetical protein
MPDRIIRRGDLDADRTLYVNGEGAVVEEDAPDRLTKIVAKGGVLSTEDAAKYGITAQDGRLAYAGAANDAEPAPKAEGEPKAEEKAVASAPANKAVTPGANKAAKGKG